MKKMNDLIAIMISHTLSIAQNSSTFFTSAKIEKMCISKKMGPIYTFFVKNITIDNKTLYSNGIVEIGKSYIRFFVSLEKSSTPIEVKIYGEHIHTACFNYWSQRGNIVLFIDADIARTTFSAFGLCGNKAVDPRFLAYWK